MALKFCTIAAMVSALALPMSSAWATNASLQEQKQGDITYITGGIGDSETKALRKSKTHYTLRVMNADKTGHFAGETRITISDADGALLLDTATGPIFYANLPEGHYLLKSFNGEQIKQQEVIIKHGKPVDIRFSWVQK